MNIQQALKFGIKKTDALDAEVLLFNVINKDKTYIHTYPEYILNKNQEKKFKEYIKRRSKHEPVAYILNTKEFYNLSFYVNKNVLVPRPETEQLVEESLKLIQKDKKIQNIIEIGTGSGCISMSIAKNIKRKNINFYATDICKRALSVAQKNIKTHKVKIKFIQSDLLNNIPNLKKEYILIANLPYLDINHKNLLKSSNTKGLKFEPSKALYSGKDGLNLYRKLFSQIKEQKNKPKYLLCEFGHKQVKELKNIIKNTLPEYTVIIKKDLAGLNRIVILNKLIYIKNIIDLFHIEILSKSNLGRR
jgi:release factor glutamine methyltransferase